VLMCHPYRPLPSLFCSQRPHPPHPLQVLRGIHRAPAGRGRGRGRGRGGQHAHGAVDQACLRQLVLV
jgi:hypothetical protein